MTRDIEAYLKDVAKRNKKVPPREGLPPRYKQYSDLAKRWKDKEAINAMNIFAYRYRLAHQFSGIHAIGIGKSLEGYNAIEAVFLAYTAYEQCFHLMTLLNSPKYQKMVIHEINDSILANSLRRNTGIRDADSGYLVASLTYSAQGQKKAKEDLLAFYRTNSTNVVPVAKSLRNYFAHGSITQHTIGLTKKSHRTALWKLADRILKECDLLWNYAIDLMDVRSQQVQRSKAVVDTGPRKTLKLRPKSR